MKFTINKDGSYSHYGTDGTINFDDTFNETNEPVNHKYIDCKWILDEEKQKETDNNLIYKQLDELAEKMLYNERYYGTDSYEATRLELADKRKELLIKLK